MMCQKNNISQHGKQKARGVVCGPLKNISYCSKFIIDAFQAAT